MVRAALTCSLLALGASGCGGGGNQTNVPDRDPRLEATGPGTLATDAYDADACSGELVPPTGYYQETAFEPLTTPNAREVALANARVRLRDRLCQGFRCEQVDSLITTWKVFEDGRQACVMVVAARAKIADWQKESVVAVERELGRIAKEIAAAVPVESGAPVVLVDTINDNGVNGGLRAEWLYGKILEALAAQAVETVAQPPGWSGLGLPDGVHAVVRGRLIVLPGQEAMVEASWQLDQGRAIRGIGSLRFPQAIAPTVDSNTYLPPLPRGSDKIALHLDARPGGALCNGQQTELWLEASEPLHVRVINLYGKGDGALVVFSTGDEPLPANKPVSLGMFQALMADVAVERFLVVAAPTREALGRFEGVEDACRIPRSMAAELHHGRGLPDGVRDYLSSTDYRLIDSDECADAYGRPGKADLSALDALPSCW